MNSSNLMKSLSGQQTAAVNNNAGAQSAFNQTANQGAPLKRINTLGMPQQKPKNNTRELCGCVGGGPDCR